MQILNSTRIVKIINVNHFTNNKLSIEKFIRTTIVAKIVLQPTDIIPVRVTDLIQIYSNNKRINGHELQR